MCACEGAQVDGSHAGLIEMDLVPARLTDLWRRIAHERSQRREQQRRFEMAKADYDKKISDMLRYIIAPIRQELEATQKCEPKHKGIVVERTAPKAVSKWAPGVLKLNPHEADASDCKWFYDLDGNGEPAGSATSSSCTVCGHRVKRSLGFAKGPPTAAAKKRPCAREPTGMPESRSVLHVMD